MIVVQLLAADQDAPREDVGAGVADLVIAVAPVMADPVDDAGRKDRNPDHLDRPDGNTDRAEQRHVDHEHQDQAFPAMARVRVALHPVIRRAVAVLLHRFEIVRLFAIKFRALPHHRAYAELPGAVRIVRCFHLGVMLAMDGGPFFRDHAGGQPQPEAEEVTDNGMKIERPMGLMTVQIDGDSGDGDVSQYECNDDVSPPWENDQSFKHCEAPFNLTMYCASIPETAHDRVLSRGPRQKTSYFERICPHRRRHRSPRTSLLNSWIVRMCRSC